MLQVFVPNVSFMFSDICYKCVYLDVAYVCNGFQALFRFFSSVSEPCFKCFICLQTYVVAIVSGCFKSRLCVCTCCNVTRLLQLLEGARGVGRGTDATWGRPGCRCRVGSGWMQTPCRAGVGAKCRHGHLNVRISPDVWALALALS
jgi:hypothetical protein